MNSGKSTMEVKYPEFAARFKEAKDKADLGLSDIHKSLPIKKKITYEMFRRYSKGIVRPSADIIQGMAEVLGVSPSWLQFGNSDVPSRNDVELPLYSDVVFYLGEGFKSDIDEYRNGDRLETETIRLPRKSLLSARVNIDESVCVMVSGNSMTPYIPDGSIIAMDKSATTIKDGALHAIYYSGILCIKVLQRMGGNKVKLKSYNPDYEDEIADINDIIVIGRVFWVSVWYDL